MTNRTPFGRIADSAAAGSDSRSTTDTTLQKLVDAIAGEVAARVKTEISVHLRHAINSVQPVLLNVKEAAVYIGRSEQAVQHLIFQKDLPVVRMGRRVHLDRRDLDTWIEKNKY